MPIVESCLEGYNGCVFAYGQTGSGKTFTISGPIDYESEPTEEELQMRGILPRSYEMLFNGVNKRKRDTDSTFLIKCSYLEIYMEKVKDLLDPTSDNLQIRQDLKKGIFVEGLTEKEVTDSKDMFELMRDGIRNRKVSCTEMNSESSRSHAILTLKIETKNKDEEKGLTRITRSEFHIIDLAGSEQQKKTGAKDLQLKEASKINQSLSSLGKVINSLARNQSHVSFRDSKLTFLLSNSLGGNSKTLMIANISPSESCYQDTLSTLKFANNTKMIKNKAHINEDTSGNVKKLQQEIRKLTDIIRKQGTEMEALKSLGSTSSDDVVMGDMTTPIKATPQKMPGITGNRQQDLERTIQELLLRLKEENETFGKNFQDYENITEEYKKTIETFKTQKRKDSMLIKFREETIDVLKKNVLGDSEKDTLIQKLQQENTELMTSIDDNPLLTELSAKLMELSAENARINREVDLTPDSVFLNQMSLLEQLDKCANYYSYYLEGLEKQATQSVGFTPMKNQMEEQRVELMKELSEKTKTIGFLKEEHLKMTHTMTENEEMRDDMLRKQREEDKRAHQKELAEQEQKHLEDMEDIKKLLCAQQESSADIKVEEFEIEKLEWNSKTKQFKSQINDLTRQLEEMTIRENSEEKELKTMREVWKIKERETAKIISGYENSIALMKEKHSQEIEEAAQTEERNDRLIKNYKLKVEDEAHKLENLDHDYNKLLDESSSKITDLEKQVSGCEDQIQELNEKYETEQQTCVFQQDQLDLKKEEYEKIVANLDVVKKREIALLEQISEHEQASAKIKSEMSDSNRQLLGDYETELKQVRDKLKHREDEKDELKMEIVTMKETIEDYMEKIVDKQKETARLEKKIKALSSRNEKYKIDINDADQQLTKMNDEINLKIREQEATKLLYTELEQNVKEISSKTLSYKEKIRELKEDNKELSEVAEENKNTIRDMVEQGYKEGMQAAQGNLDNLQKKIDSLDKENTDLRSNQNHKSKVNYQEKLKRDYNELNEKHSKTLKKIRMLEQTVECQKLAKQRGQTSEGEEAGARRSKRIR